MHAGGGADAFLDEHAMIVIADHSHAPVERRIDLDGAVRRLRRAAAERRRRATSAEIALCPAQRSAMVYGSSPRARERCSPRIVARRAGVEGVDLVMWRAGDRARAAIARRRAASCASRPGGDLATCAARRWSRRGRRSTRWRARSTTACCAAATTPTRSRACGRR